MEDLIRPFIRGQVQESLAVKQALADDETLMALIREVAELLIRTYRDGHKTLLGGNGGSAADAQHIAAEFVSRFYFDRPGLASIALTCDSSIVTAISNDYGYQHLFRRQLQANGRPGDVFIAISTSGNSPNVIEALKACPELGITRVGLTGAGGGAMPEHCDYCIRVPSDSTPRIQEAHILVGHILCSAVEEALFGNGFGPAS